MTSVAEIGEAGVAISAGDSGGRRPLFDWLRFGGIDRAALRRLESRLAPIADDVLDELIVDGAYAPYVERQERDVRRMRVDEAVAIPPGFDFRSVGGLSNEMVERLEAARPLTLGAAARVRGITPAAVAAILVHARRAAA